MMTLDTFVHLSIFLATVTFIFAIKCGTHDSEPAAPRFVGIFVVVWEPSFPIVSKKVEVVKDLGCHREIP
jgi:hypothetical protein